MTNSKSTRRALLTSALAVFLCVAMLIGTTFAWFTDTASTSVNKIQAGTLDVDLQVATEYEVFVDENGNYKLRGTLGDDGNRDFRGWESAVGKTLDFVKADEAETEEILWEPGCTYVLPPLRVVNNGNLALKFKVAISGIKGDAKLNEAIEWTLPTSYTENNLTLQPGADARFKISGHMKEEAGNEYQGLSIEGIAITVYATQAASEYDSNNNTYDKDAQLPSIWDGRTATAPAQDDDGVYHITNAAEFAQYINTFSDLTAPSFRGEYYDAKVVLDCDIDYNGNTIERSSSSYFYGQFDGQNHTIRNFKLKRKLKRVDDAGFTSLFGAFDSADTCVKNLTIENATVTGGEQTALIGTVYSGTIDNCRVYNSTIAGEKKVAAVAAYVQPNGTVKNCVAENCNIYCSDTRSEQVTVYGFNNGGTFTDNAEPVNCVLSHGVQSVVGGDVNITAGAKIGYVADATVTVDVSEGYNRIYSDNATFVNCVFNGDGNLWFRDAATFIDCTFNTVIHDAEPVSGTITFKNCTFNELAHFAPASAGASTDGKFLLVENCKFNNNFIVQGFETVTMKNCKLSGTNWAGKNMISYCPLAIDGCTFTTGIRLGYSDTSRVTCTNGTVALSWADGSATVGSD